jgi:hypothetical protein
VSEPTETNDLHEVVQLLVARMASHPEEFRYAGPAADGSVPSYGAVADAAARGYRWNSLLNEIDYFTSEAEQEALRAGLRAIHLDRLHEQVMDELLNGEERRKKEHEDYLDRQMAKAQQAMRMAQAQQAMTTYPSSGANALGQATTPIAGQKYVHQPMGQAVSISDLMDAKMDALNKQLQNTHDNSLYNAMKKLGLKK